MGKGNNIIEKTFSIDGKKVTRRERMLALKIKRAILNMSIETRATIVNIMLLEIQSDRRGRVRVPKKRPAEKKKP